MYGALIKERPSYPDPGAVLNAACPAPGARRAVNGRQYVFPPAPAPSPVTPRTCDSRFSPEQGSLVRIPSEGTCIPDDPEAGCIPVISAQAGAHAPDFRWHRNASRMGSSRISAP